MSKKKLKIFEDLSKDGFSLIPLDGKKPIELNWSKYCLKKRKFKRSDFVNKNAGVACGPASGVIVLDIDDIHAFKALQISNNMPIPITLKVKTSNGVHCYFIYPKDGNDYGCKSLKHSYFKAHTIFDIKGNGGQVVADGSTHPDTGKKYEMIENEIQETPQWMKEFILGEMEINTDALINCPLPKPKDTKFIESLSVSDKIKKLVIEKQVKGERSGKIFSVLLSLIKEGYKDDFIFFIFNHYPIGEKYRVDSKSSQKWLQSEINRAKESLGKHYPGKFSPDIDDKPQKSSARTSKFIEWLLDSCHLFHTSKNEAYVAIKTDGRNEPMQISQKQFRLYCQGQYYEKFNQTLSAQNYKEIQGIVEYKALKESDIESVYVRVAGDYERVCIDLGNADREIVKIDKNGWTICQESRYHFYRPNGMEALPHPIRSKKSYRYIKTFFHKNRFIFTSWLIGSLNPKGPYPILSIQGAQGTSKSTTTKMLKSLIDPTKASILSFPRNMEDFMISAQNSWVLAYDNLSKIPSWLSDALCQLSTGGGIIVRKLYSNDEQVIFDVKGPVILNGIKDLVIKPDLADRVMFVEMPFIPDEQRKTEAELWNAFNVARPHILALLFDAVSSALKGFNRVSVDKVPRMADFTKWIVAAEPALPWKEGAFLRAYTRNLSNNKRIQLDLNEFAKIIHVFINDREYWRGNMSQLEVELHKITKIRQKVHLPRGSAQMGKKLRQCKEILEESGVEVKEQRTAKKREVFLQKITSV